MRSNSGLGSELTPIAGRVCISSEGSRSQLGGPPGSSAIPGYPDGHSGQECLVPA